MTQCYLNTMAMLSAMGESRQDVSQQLCSGKPQLSLTSQFSSEQALPLGIYNAELPEIPLSEPKWQSRNNRFALAALNQIRPEVDQAIERYGQHRVGVIIGTSTSGISDSESYLKQRTVTGEIPENFDYCMQEMGATASFISSLLKVTGPVFGISTACSSGAKALASARRLLRAGICDAVIAGGVDTLCHLTVQGFSSLEAVSDQLCNPFSKNRSGINIGEGAGLFLVSREPHGVELAGVGESSDAHHISAPDPSGAGAIRCMTSALQDAGITAQDIGYINLHGTATPLNDQMESRAVAELFGQSSRCSSTKPFTGHTLGAAGALEAAICWLALKENFIPQHFWDNCPDPSLPAISLTKGIADPEGFQYALSNSFAFGGNNISLILGRIK